ncbi:MAG: FHA domain-containing protein, partial [Planctomycetota bacterium]
MSELSRVTLLVDKWIDGGLLDAEREELEGLLNNDGGARRAFIHQLKLHASLVLNQKGTGNMNFEGQNMIHVTLETPEAGPRELAFDQPAVIIGRSNDSVLPIEDLKASRMHCQILRTSHGFEMVDLGSSNGTQVNGKTVTRAPLTPGDRIQIGLTVIVFRGAGPAPIPIDEAMSETPPEAIPVASLKEQKPAAPVPSHKKSSGVHPRPSSARMAASSSKSHLVPLITFAAIFALFMVPVYIFVLAPKDPGENPSSGTSSLKSSGASGEERDFREFEKLDEERRRAQKEKEEEIKRKAEEAWQAQSEQSKRIEAEEKKKEAEAEAAKVKEITAKEAAETERKRKEAEKRAKRRAAEAEVFLKEKEAFSKIEPDISVALKKLEFEPALEIIREFQAGVKTEAGVELAVIRADEIRSMSSAFGKMWKNVEAGESVEVKGRVIKIKKADARGFTGTMGRMATTKRWVTLTPEEIYPLLDWIGMTAEDRYGVGLICFEFGLQEEGEYQLAKCVAKDKSRKLFLDLLVARVRGVQIPPGGFIVHDDQWVTSQEKALIEKGYRRHNGQWMTEEEINKSKGLVKVGDTWMTPAEAKAKEKLDKKIAKLAPKGYIDKNGWYDG